ncbi:acyl carrier protein, chloroplastic-like isoform X2 [Apium graveolens]|uniref:acyl carrier protein, chloroplastic-like isoform X2 n=1 Tax=Apium graveolens TaxID=4045 RepID=UPI003D78CAD3
MASLLSTSATLLVNAVPFAPKCKSSTPTHLASSSPLCGLRTVPKIQIPYAAARRSLPISRSLKTTTISCSAAKPETLQIVQNTIAKQLSIDETAVAPGIKFADLGADSLDTVEIMMALEEKFGVSIGEGGAENIATVQDAADLIEKVKAASA